MMASARMVIRVGRREMHTLSLARKAATKAGEDAEAETKKLKAQHINAIVTHKSLVQQNAILLNRIKAEKEEKANAVAAKALDDAKKKMEAQIADVEKQFQDA